MPCLSKVTILLETVKFVFWDSIEAICSENWETYKTRTSETLLTQ